MYKIDISERTLHFKQPAGTSRGVYTTRHSDYLTLTSAEHPGIRGVGECATLPDLSCDAKPEYELTLRQVCQMVEQMGRIPYDMIRAYPSITFGLETAFADFFRQCPASDVPAWATYLASLFKELDLIKRIRQVYSKEQIELRVDANGGFTPENAMSRLEALAQYDIHSIEQPIRQHQWPKMAALCRESPLPIALDEELIGVNVRSMKQALLDTIHPQYIVLKPSLHGGIYGCREWIQMASERGIGSWITSALESNVGLSAIAHFCAKTYGPGVSMPQGLGTGQLFTDNIPMPLQIKGEKIFVNG